MKKFKPFEPRKATACLDKQPQNLRKLELTQDELMHNQIANITQKRRSYEGDIHDPVKRLCSPTNIFITDSVFPSVN